MEKDNKNDQPLPCAAERRYMKKLDIFEYAEQHKDCPEHANEYEIDGKKYIVHSHFVGQKDIDKVLSDIAVNRALSETLYGDNNAVDDNNTVPSDTENSDKIA